MRSGGNSDSGGGKSRRLSSDRESLVVNECLMVDIKADWPLDALL